MIRKVHFGDDSLSKLLDRRPLFDPALVATVSETIQEVANDGAAAVLRHTQRFDAAEATSVFHDCHEVSDEALEPRHKSAIDTAIERVREFHEVQLETLTEGWAEIGDSWGWRTYSDEERESGMVGQRMLPVARAGIYVPGGQADYPSSVVMNVVPALVARVGHVTVATPPRRDGTVSPAVVYACRQLRIERILTAGGASAIAAMALGIEGLERVDVIAGPGNRYVNEAKRQLWGSVGLDSYAGPSEVCVLVDESSEASFAAADLIAQVEHAEDNVGLLVSTSEQKIAEVLVEVDRQLADAPRASTVRSALTKGSAAVLCNSQAECAEVVNRFAPEHLALLVEEPESWIALLKNAGAVMMGRWTAQAVGDYCEGPSHTLPTAGAARFASPVSVSTFLKTQTVTMLEEDDARELAPVALAISEIEGLPAHGRSATIRTESNSE